MINIKIIAVGTLKEKYWTAACDEYTKRLSVLCKFAITELQEAKMPKNPSDALIQKALDLEADAILKAAQGYKIIPLCIEGTMYSSEKLAQHIDKLAGTGFGSIAFVIGSSHGLSPKVKNQGAGISMSPMTFPHQLARVMLCEQIYRAFQIITGTKYHK